MPARPVLALLMLAAWACGSAAQEAAPAPAVGTAPEVASPPYAAPVQPASDEAEAALAGFSVGAGLSVSLVAAEPLLANPVCFAFDAAGVLYVGETFRHGAGVLDIRDHREFVAADFAATTVAERLALMQSILGAEFPTAAVEHDRVKRLLDRDGDGRVDEATVFADGFSEPAAGIGAGLLAHDGTLYYTCIPALWALVDADGDGIAEQRSRLSDGYGVRIGYLGHDLHGLVLGPDGRLWFSIGDRGLHVVTPEGVLHLPDTGCVLRCEPDGSALEIVHTGLRNPQELAFDDFGDLFTGDNNADGGDRARLVQVLPGGDSGWRGPFQWVDGLGPWNAERRWQRAHAGQPAFLLPPLDHLTAGPSGFACNPGTGLLPGEEHHFVLCDFQGSPSGSGVYSFALLPEGAGFRLGPTRRPLWGLLATDVDFAPDGSLVVSDWVTGWSKSGKGRLYRLRETEPEAARRAAGEEAAAQRAAGMAARDEAELVALLSSVDRRVRLDAQLALAARGRAGLEALAGVLAAAPRAAPADAAGAAPAATGDGADGEALADEATDARDRRLLPAIHAAWGLGVLARRDSTLATEAVAALLAAARRPPAQTTNRTAAQASPQAPAGSDELVVQALAVLGDLAPPEAAAVVRSALADASPRVRLRAALAAGRLADPAAVDALLARAPEDAGDPVLRHGLVMGLLGCAQPEVLHSLVSSPDPQVRQLGLLVLRRRADPLLAAFLDDAEPGLVLEAARAIHDERIEAALPALADHLDSEAWHARFTPRDTEASEASETDSTDERASEPEAAEGREDQAASAPTAADTELLWRRALGAAFRVGGAARAEQVARYAERTSAPAALRAEALQRLASWQRPPALDTVTGFSWPLPEREAGYLDALCARLLSAGAETEDTDVELPDEVAEAWARLVEARLEAPRAGQSSGQSSGPASGAASGAASGPASGAASSDVDPLLLAEALDQRLARLMEMRGRDVSARLAAFEARVAWAAAVRPSESAATCTERRSALLDVGLADPAAELRAAALLALQQLDPAETMPRLPALLAEGELPERRAALSILGATPPGALAARADELLGTQLDALLAGRLPAELSLDVVLAAEACAARAAGAADADTPGVPLAERLAAHRARLAAQDETLAPWLDALFGGDPQAGRELFTRNDLQCVRCHEGEAGADTVGPSLAGIGRRLARAQILQALADPNARTAPGYGSERFLLSDGRSLAGRVLSGAAGRAAGQGAVRLQDADGHLQSFDAALVAERRQAVSAMPEGLLAPLSRTEVRDLLAYLASL